MSTFITALTISFSLFISQHLGVKFKKNSTTNLIWLLCIVLAFSLFYNFNVSNLVNDKSVFDVWLNNNRSQACLAFTLYFFEAAFFSFFLFFPNLAWNLAWILFYCVTLLALFQLFFFLFLFYPKVKKELNLLCFIGVGSVNLCFFEVGIWDCIWVWRFGKVLWLVQQGMCWN